MPVSELRRRIGHGWLNEEELVVDPRLFFALARRLPAVRGVRDPGQAGAPLTTS